MDLANPMQKFQDWFSQQWVILWGKRIEPKDYDWLLGPFGNLNGIGEDFINQLAEKENLIVSRNSKSTGLIPSIRLLNLSDSDLARLSAKVVSFYENTTNYSLNFSVKWNPFFKPFGKLVNILFSSRINQLNIPTRNIKSTESLKSEIITLTDKESGIVKYTIWLRSFVSTGKVIYTGVYSICDLPSGYTGVKAVFPLPNGNATVIMKPTVGKNGELILSSSGSNLGDAGFYFLLKDSRGKYWHQPIKSFSDQLIMFTEDDHLSAEQTLTLWSLSVLKFKYQIEKKI